VGSPKVAEAHGRHHGTSPTRGPDVMSGQIISPSCSTATSADAIEQILCAEADVPCKRKRCGKMCSGRFKLGEILCVLVGCT
jgi:hypothetical protein